MLSGPYLAAELKLLILLFSVKDRSRQVWKYENEVHWEIYPWFKVRLYTKNTQSSFELFWLQDDWNLENVTVFSWFYKSRIHNEIEISVNVPLIV